MTSTPIDLGRPIAGDVVELILDDHRRFETLLRQLRDSSSDRDTVRQAFAALHVAHAEAEERHVYRATLYFRDELELMLRTAGFADVAVLAADGDRPAAAADTRVMVVARKAG